MRSFVLGAMVVLICAVTLCRGAESPSDYRHRVLLQYTVKSRSNGLRIVSVETNSRVYLNERSLRTTAFYEYATHFNQFTDMSASVNGDKLSRRWSRVANPTWTDSFLDDSYVWTIELPKRPKVGDSVWYELERDWTGAAYLPLHDIPVLHDLTEYVINVEHPSDVQVEFEVIPGRTALRSSIDHPDTEHSQITFRDLPSAPRLYAFPFNNAHGYVRISMKQNGVDATRQTVSDFGTWYESQFPQSCDLTSLQRDSVLKLVPKHGSAVDTLRCIYDYIRDHVNYLGDERGVNAHIPRLPSAVFRNSVGDCKDKAHLLASLARSVGIEAHMALISTTTRPITTDVVTMDQFNHAICVAVVHGDTIYVDPTATYHSFDELPGSDDQHRVFIINGARSAWASAHRRGQQPELSIEARVSMRNLTQGSLTARLRQDNASNARYAKRTKSGEELVKYLSNMIGGDLVKIRVVDPSIVSVSDTVVVVRATADFSTFFASSPRRMYAPTQPFRFFDADLLDRRTDDLPVVFRTQTNVELALDIRDVAGTAQDTSIVMSGPRGLQYAYTLRPTGQGTAMLHARAIGDRIWFDGSNKTGLIDFAQSYFRLRKVMVDVGGGQ